MIDPTGATFRSSMESEQRADYSTSRDISAHQPPPPRGTPKGYHGCGKAICNGLTVVNGWDIVTGEIYSPKNTALQYLVRLNSDSITPWVGVFQIGEGRNPKDVIRKWIPQSSVWLESPVIFDFGASRGYKRYPVKVANRLLASGSERCC